MPPSVQSSGNLLFDITDNPCVYLPLQYCILFSHTLLLGTLHRLLNSSTWPTCLLCLDIHNTILNSHSKTDFVYLIRRKSSSSFSVGFTMMLQIFEWTIFFYHESCGRHRAGVVRALDIFFRRRFRFLVQF